MIKECNFKYSEPYLANPNWMCGVSKQICVGEDNCILYQIYNNTLIDDSICYKNRIPL